MTWVVELYESTSGQKPVEKFIRGLQPPTIAKVRNQLNLLEKYGPTLSMPNAKPIGGGLFELRVRGKEEVRGLYVFVVEHRVTVLHIFKKKTFSISKNDLDIAVRRKREVVDRKSLT